MKTLANIALVIISLVLFFGTLELGARFLSPPCPAFKAQMPVPFKHLVVPDDKLGFRLAEISPQGAQGVRTYAGRPVSVAKPPRVYRIICVGGATTLGVNGPLDSYPAQLQDIFNFALRGQHKKVEVINAGMLGYHGWHSYLRADDELDGLNPDMYLLMDGLNDVMAAAAIENVAQAVKRHEQMTRLINPVTGQDSWWAKLIRWPEHLAFYRLAKLEFAALTLDSIMEKKMAAFKFQENLENFIKGRQAKGLGVTLVNYGWIIRDKARPKAEAARIPYEINIPLFQFGRAYVGRVISQVAQEFDTPMIDLQGLIDTLCGQYPSVFRVFTDELHYTPLADYQVARHIYAQLLEQPPLKNFLNGLNPASLEAVDAHFACRLAWGEYFVGHGFPLAGQEKPVPITSMQSNNLVERPQQGLEGWSCLVPSDPAQEGVVFAHLSHEPSLGRVLFYPRIFSNQGWVTVEKLSDTGWTLLANLVKYHDDGQWSPVEDRQGFPTDQLGPGGALLRIRLLGMAQLYHRGGNFFFRQTR